MTASATCTPAHRQEEGGDRICGDRKRQDGSGPREGGSRQTVDETTRAPHGGDQAPAAAGPCGHCHRIGSSSSAD